MKEKNTQNSSELFKVTILWIVIFHSASDNQVQPAHFPQALCPLAALSKSSCCTYEWLYSSHPLYNRTIFSISISQGLSDSQMCVRVRLHPCEEWGS